MAPENWRDYLETHACSLTLAESVGAERERLR